MEFSVVDVETTGVFPNGHDRIIEIAALRVDVNGRIIKYFDTLVNPERDVGVTHIHGIKASDVINAPRFEEIAGDVINILSDSVFVAHNVSFDYRFVKAEFHRIGISMPDTSTLCTMQLAREADPSIRCRNLGFLCQHFGIPVEESHQAFQDAVAASKILTHCIQRIGHTFSHLIRKQDCECLKWPQLPCSGKSYRRSTAAFDQEHEITFIQRLLEKLPCEEKGENSLDEYLFCLDKILEDRIVEKTEYEQLLHLARESGLSQDQAISAHHTYMRDLITIALADGVITENEKYDLEKVRHLLNIQKETFDNLISDAQEKRGSGESACSPSSNCSNEFDGLSVCFTGELSCRYKGSPITRKIAESMAKEHGMIVKKSVTTDLDVLVVADPNTMSGKAKKARKYEIRIIAEPVFWNTMGVNIE